MDAMPAKLCLYKRLSQSKEGQRSPAPVKMPIQEGMNADITVQKVEAMPIH
jgi:hypothetical protein